jgi:hypothetical protein
MGEPSLKRIAMASNKNRGLSHTNAKELRAKSTNRLMRKLDNAGFGEV